jgi:hypothetical protein
LQLGHEREAAICLMQKFIDQELQGQPLLIKSAVALDHLKGYFLIALDLVLGDLISTRHSLMWTAYPSLLGFLSSEIP